MPPQSNRPLETGNRISYNEHNKSILRRLFAVNNKNILTTIGVALVLLVTGYIFVEYNTWMGYTESSIVYLAAVIGAGCYWIGSK